MSHSVPASGVGFCGGFWLARPPPPKELSCEAQRRRALSFFFLPLRFRALAPSLPPRLCTGAFGGESIREVNFQTPSHSKIGQPQRAERGRQTGGGGAGLKPPPSLSSFKKQQRSTAIEASSPRKSFLFFLFFFFMNINKRQVCRKQMGIVLLCSL